MKRLVRLLFWLVGLGLVAGLVVAAFWPQPIPVETVLVGHGPLEELVREDGMTRVRERYTVSSPVAGRLARIRLEPGDEIVSGRTLLASIEPADPGLLDSRQLAQAEARVAAAKAAHDRTSAGLDQAEAALQRAREKLKRSEGLLAAGAEAPEEVEIDRTGVRMADEAHRMAAYDREIARFELDQAEAAVRHVQAAGNGPGQPPFEINSPVPGRVLKVLQESATVVVPGTPLVEIGDLRDLEVVIDVLTTDAVRIGDRATIRLEQWGGGAPINARVRMIEPSAFTKFSALGVEEQRVNVLADFANPAEAAALGDGYRVEAAIVTWSQPDVLQVPAGALFRQDGKWSAFRIVDGVAERVEVGTGHRSETHVEVLSGLQAGDEVVLYPSDMLKPGARVVVKAR